MNVYDCRIFYIISGTANITIDNQQHYLKESSVFYCPMGSIYTISSDNGCTLFSLNFDLTQKRNDIIKYYTPVKLCKKKPPIFKNEDIVEDCDLFNSFIHIKDPVDSYGKIKTIVQEFSDKKIFFREKCGDT